MQDYLSGWDSWGRSYDVVSDNGYSWDFEAIKNTNMEPDKFLLQWYQALGEVTNFSVNEVCLALEQQVR
jgi:hypothetical protein